MLKYFLMTGWIVLRLQLFGQQLSYPLQTQWNTGNAVLKNGFLNPPPESKLRCYWWWLNSMATKESITRDLEEMKAKGYGGASIVDAGSSSYNVAKKTKAGPVFMSPEWMELYRHAVREADRVGIELSVNIQSGWNPGGPSITPELALKKIVTAETDITGGRLITVPLPQPETRLLYQDVMIQAIPKPDKIAPLRDEAIANWSKKTLNRSMGSSGIYPLYELREGFFNTTNVNIVKQKDIIDVTSFFDGKVLKWDAPAGDWTIIRYGWTCTGVETSTTSDGWNGLSMDHLNPDAFRHFSKTVIEPLIHTAQSVGNSVKFLQTDSWEMGAVNWTQNFPAEFRNNSGYDIMMYMPILAGRVVESQEVSNRFLYDFRKTIGACVAKNHYQLFADLAHQYGMGIHPESGGPHSAPVDALKTMAISDFPQGEFWAMANTHRVSDAARLAVKQSACVAHTNGKRFVAAEGPTSIGPQWERSPAELKTNLDRVFCSGVNRIVWHTFTSSPREFGLPGNEYFAGTHMNPNVTWWQQAGDFTGYLNRSSFMLQQGLFVADVLYYYGDDVPNFVFLKEEFPQLAYGYDWDKCAADVLYKVTVKNGKLVLPDGMSYRLLVLPQEQTINLDVLKKVEELVRNGATILAPRPQRATGLKSYPLSDTELNAISRRLWGNIDGKQVLENKYGKGRVIWGRDINAVLRSMQAIPDFEFTGSDTTAALEYIHRQTAEADIYFVSNRFLWKEFSDFVYRYLPSEPDRYASVECRFRVTGKAPQLWDPVTGKIEDVVNYRVENGQTVIPLYFGPGASKLIVFTNPLKKQLPVSKITGTGTALLPHAKPFVELRERAGAVLTIVNQPGRYELQRADGKRAVVMAKQPVFIKKLDSPWTVKFDTAWNAPAAIILQQLQSWTEFENPDIKYYSGSATYVNDFYIDKLEKRKYELNLGNVQDMATVIINGKSLGTIWAAPFVTDITDYIKPGKNQVEIVITNLWANRLIGDGRLPVDRRLTKTNIVKFDDPDADKYLRRSGLLGPVVIYGTSVHNVSFR